MKSRGVGCFLPLTCSTLSRIVCMPEMLAISSSVKGASIPLVEKSKFSASDSSESASISKGKDWTRSEAHKSELQSLMRITYADSCLKKNKTTTKSKHKQ